MEITINGVCSQQTSYGIVTLNLIRSLSKLGHKVNAVPIGGRADFSKDDTLTPAALANAQKPFDRLAPSIRLYHQFSLLENAGRGLSIGFPIFELDDFAPHEITNLRMCDRLLCCSRWAKEVIVKCIEGLRTDVVPLGVDRDIFYEKKEDEQVSTQPYTFYYPGKYEYRKGFDLIPEVFHRAFPTGRENYRIVLLPNNYFISSEQTNEWIRFLSTSKIADKISIVPRLETNKQVSELTRQADCVVSFSRAEGWSMGLLEGLSCGCDVIAMNYSGQTEFLSNENSTLLDCSKRELAYDGVFFHGNGNWLSYEEDDIERMANAVREVYNRGRRINEKGIETAIQFSWENSAKRLVESLE